MRCNAESEALSGVFDGLNGYEYVSIATTWRGIDTKDKGKLT